ncbi:hypothetical protein V2G26_016050 [Clonostachys chloroleuca]
MHGVLVIRGVVVVWARISCLLAITPSHFRRASVCLTRYHPCTGAQARLAIIQQVTYTSRWIVVQTCL